MMIHENGEDLKMRSVIRITNFPLQKVITYLNENNIETMMFIVGEVHYGTSDRALVR